MSSKDLKARLAAYQGEALTDTFPLPAPGTTIGRDSDSHICLNHPEVSRNHAAIHAKDNMWVLKDLESTNGVFVNECPMKYAVLKDGDMIRIGPFDLIFEVSDAGVEWSPASTTNPATERRRRTLSQQREGGEPGGAPTRPIK